MYRRGAARAGRDGSTDEVVCRFMVCVTDEVPAARDAMRAAFGAYAATPVYNKFFQWCGFESQAHAIAAATAVSRSSGPAIGIGSGTSMTSTPLRPA